VVGCGSDELAGAGFGEQLAELGVHGDVLSVADNVS